MCNPRKIRIKVAETIQEAWNEALTVTVVEENHVEHIERWRTPVTLNHTLGQGALLTLEKMIRDQWQWHQTEPNEPAQYSWAVPGYDNVEIYYLPHERCFEIRARGEETRRTTVTASTEVDLAIDQVIEVVGEGVYYTDWAGHGRDFGEQIARENARRKIDIERNKWRERAKEQAQREHQERLHQQPRKETKVLISRQLQQQVKERLQQALPTVTAVIARFLAEVYVQTLRDMAEQSGGRVICDQQISEDLRECTIVLPN